jgi:5-methyltetrahydrofolate--homocysteine methyltransferase
MLEPGENAGMSITESFAMMPTAAVSGWYFAHPDSRYFPVVRIQKDQIEDYAERKGQDLMTTERWLQSVLGYDV